MTTDNLKARVEQALALAAAAPGGAITREYHTPKCEVLYLGRDSRYHGLNVVYLSEPSPQWPPLFDLMAAAPDLAALVADLWAAYMAACDRADGRDRMEAMERADAAARKDIGVRLGLQSADDSPSCLADFEDAILEARAERDIDRTERDAIAARLAEAREWGERYLWNLAGCSTYAVGVGLDEGHAPEMALPALDDVRALALRERELRLALVDVLSRYTDYAVPAFAVNPMMRTRWVTVDRVVEWRRLAGVTRD